MSFEIKHIHADVGFFSGNLYFTVNNKLMVVEVGTPHFNDFNEFRIGEIRISEKDYDPKVDAHVKPTPYNIEPINISKGELEYLQLFFPYDANYWDNEDFDKKIKEYMKNNNAVYPFLHEYDFSANLYSDLKGIHFNMTEYDEEGEFKSERTFTEDEWLFKEDIREKDGIYNLLIPIMKGFIDGYCSQ